MEERKGYTGRAFLFSDLRPRHSQNPKQHTCTTPSCTPQHDPPTPPLNTRSYTQNRPNEKRKQEKGSPTGEADRAAMLYLRCVWCGPQICATSCASSEARRRAVTAGTPVLGFVFVSLDPGRAAGVMVARKLVCDSRDFFGCS